MPTPCASQHTVWLTTRTTPCCSLPLSPQDWDDTTVDWFTDREAEGLPLPEFRLNFLWMEKNIAVGVDQVYARGNSAPLTEFFVWPRKDAWEELKVALEGRAWISDVDKIRLLNR